MVNEAVILAGGLGTRLRDLVTDLPKVMAPVSGRPFLEYLLDYISGYGISEIILATGYKGETISSHFGDKYKNLNIKYSVETKALGTGGAVLKALPLIKGDSFWLFNGDTFFAARLDDMSKTASESGFRVTIGLKSLENFDRYGAVEVDASRIISFSEKTYRKAGAINGGVYIMEKSFISDYSPSEVYSLEHDLIEKYITKGLGYYLSDGYFIDIGIPEDYRRADKELPIVIRQSRH